MSRRDEVQGYGDDDRGNCYSGQPSSDEFEFLMCILYVRRRKLEPSVDVAKVGGLLNAGCVKGTPPLSGRPCMIQW